MFRRLLKRRAPVRAPEVPRTPDGMVVWAIGDVHGRADLLKPLTEAIRADLDASDAPRKMVVFLGDYVDRGPGSREVLKYLAALPADEGVEWRFLKGNHEETMVNFLDDPSVGTQWCEYGGEATLQAYGLRPPSLKHRVEAWRHLSSELDHKLDEDERTFLSNLELSVTAGDYFLVHAGARPGAALADQSDEDLMWIRGEFLRSEVEFEKVVVHGHTPTAEVHADRRRIGIDTRAYASGVLTGLRLEGRDRRILQAVAPRASSGLSEGGFPPAISLRWANLPAFADLRVTEA
jgi:serine/threonine protein phosphatase 1